jgi:pimeloyl-ACP methyl ester carboxylesterase
MQIIVDELLTNYERKASASASAHAPVMLVLHGWGDNLQNWRAFADYFSKKYDVVLIDLPGFGGTQAPHETWGLDEYAQFVAHFLDKLKLRPEVLVGHSNGGAIVIRGLARGVLEADKLVLLASAGIRSEYKGRKKLVRLIAKSGKVLAQPLPGRIKDHLRRKLYTTVGSDMLVAEHLQATFKRVVEDDVQADATSIGQPTLLIYGEGDVSTPPNFGRMLHERIAGSTFELLGDAGHFVYQD